MAVWPGLAEWFEEHRFLLTASEMLRELRKLLAATHPDRLHDMGPEDIQHNTLLCVAVNHLRDLVNHWSADA